MVCCCHPIGYIYVYADYSVIRNGERYLKNYGVTFSLDEEMSDILFNAHSSGHQPIVAVYESNTSRSFSPIPSEHSIDSSYPPSDDSMPSLEDMIYYFNNYYGLNYT